MRVVSAIPWRKVSNVRARGYHYFHYTDVVYNAPDRRCHTDTLTTVVLEYRGYPLIHEKYYKVCVCTYIRIDVMYNMVLYENTGYFGEHISNFLVI